MVANIVVLERLLDHHEIEWIERAEMLRIAQLVRSVRVHHQRDRPEPLPNQPDGLDIPPRLDLDLDAAIALGQLDPFDLMMIEQPLEYDDIRDHARLQERIATPICLDESLHTPRLADEALATGACRIINIKPGRVGGHAQSIRMHDVAVAHGAPVWHGGMLESGIGRAHNIHLSTLPGFTLPGDVAASRRYFSPDLIDPEIEIRPDGTIAVPAGPGIGVNIIPERIAAASVERLELARH